MKFELPFVLIRHFMHCLLTSLDFLKTFDNFFFSFPFLCVNVERWGLSPDPHTCELYTIPLSYIPGTSLMSCYPKYCSYHLALNMGVSYEIVFSIGM